MAKAPFPGGVVCHPHPLYGGDMENNVVIALCEALTSVGVAALRFNFRGVGKSQGIFDGGKGEKEDVRSAVGYLRAHMGIDKSRTILAGYSFGAPLALEVGLVAEGVKAVVAVGCPVSALERLELFGGQRPILIIAGEHDHLAKVDQLHKVVERIPGPVDVRVVPGADHFFHGDELLIAQHVADFARRCL